MQEAEKLQREEEKKTKQKKDRNKRQNERREGARKEEGRRERLNSRSIIKPRRKITHTAESNTHKAVVVSSNKLRRDQQQ